MSCRRAQSQRSALGVALVVAAPGVCRPRSDGELSAWMLEQQRGEERRVRGTYHGERLTRVVLSWMQRPSDHPPDLGSLLGKGIELLAKGGPRRLLQAQADIEINNDSDRVNAIFSYQIDRLFLSSTAGLSLHDSTSYLTCTRTFHPACCPGSEDKVPFGLSSDPAI